MGVSCLVFCFIYYLYMMQREKGHIEDCFRVLRVEEREDELFVPACVQFKIRNFTDVNFDNLTATVSGVLCVNFLIFT